MKSLFEEMGGTYRQEGDYLIPNLALPDEPEYQIGKYGRMRRSYLKEHRPVLYASLLTSGTLHRHLAEVDQACNERMAIIVSDKGLRLPGRLLLSRPAEARKTERHRTSLRSSCGQRRSRFGVRGLSLRKGCPLHRMVYQRGHARRRASKGA